MRDTETYFVILIIVVIVFLVNCQGHIEAKFELFKSVFSLLERILKLRVIILPELLDFIIHYDFHAILFKLVGHQFLKSS